MTHPTRADWLTVLRAIRDHAIEIAVALFVLLAMACGGTECIR